MDGLETTLQRVAAWLSMLMDPLDQWLGRLGLSVRQQLDRVGVPSAWHSTILTALWVLLLAMAIRTLTGWARLVLVVVAALVLAKAYGLLPGA